MDKTFHRSHLDQHPIMTSTSLYSEIVLVRADNSVVVV